MFQNAPTETATRRNAQCPRKLGEKLGVLVVQSKQQRAFTDDEVYALEVVAMVLAEMAERRALREVLAEAFDPSAPELGLPVEVTWSSEDESVVSVDTEGVVTGGDVAGSVWIGAQIGDDESTRPTKRPRL